MGRWAGPLPYDDATDCRVKLLSDGRFEAACKEDAWVGVGTYVRDGDRLTLTYRLLTHHGTTIKEPQPIRYRFVGQGNTLRLNGDSGEAVWVRKMGG